MWVLGQSPSTFSLSVRTLSEQIQLNPFCLFAQTPGHSSMSWTTFSCRFLPILDFILLYLVLFNSCSIARIFHAGQSLKEIDNTESQVANEKNPYDRCFKVAFLLASVQWIFASFKAYFKCHFPHAYFYDLPTNMISVFWLFCYLFCIASCSLVILKIIAVLIEFQIENVV